MTKLRVYRCATWAFPKGHAYFGLHTYGYTWSCSCGAQSRGAHPGRPWIEALRDGRTHFKRKHTLG